MFTEYDTNFGNAFVDSFNNSYWKPFIHQEPHWEIEAKWWTKADLVSYNLKISGWEQQVLKMCMEYSLQLTECIIPFNTNQNPMK